MAHIIDLATGQVCGPAADEQPERDRADTITAPLRLELQHTAAPRREPLPADLRDADAGRFIEKMEKV